MDFVWLEHPETGGKAQFSTDSAPVWQARGWVPCDPPAQPDPTKAITPPAPPAKTRAATAAKTKE